MDSAACRSRRLGCLHVELEKHVLVDCPAQLLLQRRFIYVLRNAGILWERSTVVDKVLLYIDPRAKAVPVVGSLLRSLVGLVRIIIQMMALPEGGTFLFSIG